MNVYQRVNDLVNNITAKMTMPELFRSREYREFIEKKTANIISGTFYHLRQEGFNASQSAENRLLSRLHVEVIHEPHSDVTAYAADSGIDQRVVLNTAHPLVMERPSREERHLAVLGMLYHEVGHILYTDYPTKRCWLQRLSSKKWFPCEPDNLKTVGGAAVERLMSDDALFPLTISMATGIENRIEDGYVETEVRLMCPGMGKAALSVINLELIDSIKSLGEDDPANPEKEELYDILNQVLLYSKFGEIKVAPDYDGPMLDAIYDCIDIIDNCRTQRDPEKRISGTNELLCILGPYVEKAVMNEVKRQKQQQQQQQSGKAGKAGQSGASQPQTGSSSQKGSGSSGQGQKQPGQGGANGQGQNAPSEAEKKAAVQNIQKKLQEIIKNGASNENKDCSSEAVNKPTSAQNAQQQTGSKGQSNNTNGPGGMGDSAVDLDAAKREVDSVTKTFAKDKAIQQAESERTQELNKEASQSSIRQYGGYDQQISVSRAATVEESNVRVYEHLYPQVSAISRGMQRGIKRILKDRREGGKIRNLPFGRRFEVSSVVHDDGRYFSKKKLPTEPPKLGVGLLVDESGSTGGDLINAAMLASLVIEDFCRELDIPHLIYGYTTGRGVEMISYAEPQDVGNSNRYRITGMRARMGTPTANSMGFIYNQMKKLNADVRILFVITDGQSGDNYSSIGGSTPIKRMIKDFKKEKTMVIAAGIGRNRKVVESEFGEDNFLDITDTDAMPEQLIEIIKRNLWL